MIYISFHSKVLKWCATIWFPVWVRGSLALSLVPLPVTIDNRLVWGVWLMAQISSAVLVNEQQGDLGWAVRDVNFV